MENDIFTLDEVDPIDGIILRRLLIEMNKAVRIGDAAFGVVRSDNRL